MTKEERYQTFKKFNSLKFGTSGIRAKVKDMTDIECYINTKGFLKFLKNKGEIKTHVAIAGDLRQSTPKIMSSVKKAIEDSGFEVLNLGFIPTPALSYYAWQREIPAIMITGSHIPDDLNGIKFTKKNGEVLKEDEKEILENVTNIREEEYKKDKEDSLFDLNGSFKTEIKFPISNIQNEAEEEFIKRYINIFDKNILTEKKIILYEQSAVGRDLLKKILQSLGAEVISKERENHFIPIDTEKMEQPILDKFRKWAKEEKPFAIVSLDGDSDRPILTDENGNFLFGDLLGLLVSIYLKPDFVSLPISSNDSCFSILEKEKIEYELTKIGSPYCIFSMKEKILKEPEKSVASWERNGGYLLGSDFLIEGKTIKRLPTRDAYLPILITLIFAIKNNKKISELLNEKLLKRYMASGAIDNKYPKCSNYTTDIGKKIIKIFSTQNSKIKEVVFEKELKIIPQTEGNQENKEEATQIKKKIENYFNQNIKTKNIFSINYIDGIRITFEDKDVIHLRPSSNAPEFRIYTTSNTKEEAEKLMSDGFSILPDIIQDLVA